MYSFLIVAPWSVLSSSPHCVRVSLVPFFRWCHWLSGVSGLVSVWSPVPVRILRDIFRTLFGAERSRGGVYVGVGAWHLGIPAKGWVSADEHVGMYEWGNAELEMWMIVYARTSCMWTRFSSELMFSWPRGNEMMTFGNKPALSGHWGCSTIEPMEMWESKYNFQKKRTPTDRCGLTSSFEHAKTPFIST